MLRRKTILLVVFILLTITGCSNNGGSLSLKEQVNVIEQQLISEQWESVTQQAEQLIAAYQKHEWKLQLLGDEGEYEQLHEAIFRLSAAITEQNKTAARLELATIKSIIDDIYSL